MVSNPTDFPDAFETSHSLVEIQEPMTNATIIVPQGLLLLFVNTKPRSKSHLC